MRHARRQAMAAKDGEQSGKTEKCRFSAFRGIAALLVLAALGFGGYQALTHPQTPLPPAWNPTQPLRVSHPVTPITQWKLGRAAGNLDKCIGALNGAAAFSQTDDLVQSDQCHIRGRVNLTGVGSASIAPLDTRCAVALRMAMWERHSLQPAARELLGTDVTGIRLVGSYNCRALRTTDGPSTRMSTHATANAVDIAGFRLFDGRQISLLEDWDSGGATGLFLRAVRDGACDWFNLTLSPEYNALHADHFHLQSVGWGLCR
jgi:hypothetical protein